MAEPFRLSEILTRYRTALFVALFALGVLMAFAGLPTFANADSLAASVR